MIEKEKCLLQHVVTVEMNAKYHSNLKKTDLSTVENASKITDHKKLHLDSTEVQEVTDQEKCLLQHVVTVEMNAKYHSNLKKTDLSTVENASKITDKKR